ncbi:hypothetical protein D9M72_464960 [compost metagenome]
MGCAAHAGPRDPGPARDRPDRPRVQEQVAHIEAEGRHIGRTVAAAVIARPFADKGHRLVAVGCAEVGGRQPRRHRQQRQRNADGGQAPPRQRLAHQRADRAAAQQRQRQHGPAGQRQPAQRGAIDQAALDGLVEAAHHAVQGQSDKGDLADLRRSLVPAHGQAHAGQEDQQRAVGQRATVIARVGLAAEGIGKWLDLVAPAQQVGGVPDAGAGREEEQCRGQPGGVGRAQPVAEAANHQRADPEHQRAVLAVRAADDIWHQPVVQVAGGQLPHDAKAGGVLVLPRIAAEQADHAIDDADRQQQRARQGAGRGSGQLDG